MPEILPGKRIQGMRVRGHRGCGGCPAGDLDCRARLITQKVLLRHTGDERWDNWGHIVSVFDPDEVVEVEITHDGETIYCASAVSTRYPGTSDYVHLKNFEDV